MSRKLEPLFPQGSPCWTGTLKLLYGNAQDWLDDLSYLCRNSWVFEVHDEVSKDQVGFLGRLTSSEDPDLRIWLVISLAFSLNHELSLMVGEDFSTSKGRQTYVDTLQAQSFLNRWKRVMADNDPFDFEDPQ